MNLIKRIKARYNKVPYKVETWYNTQLYVPPSLWNTHSYVKVLNDNGIYMSCPGLGDNVIYVVNGIEYVYKIVEINNDYYNAHLYHHPADYIDVTLTYVKKYTIEN